MTLTASGVGQPANNVGFIYSPNNIPSYLQSDGSMAVLGRDPQSYPSASVSAAESKGTIIAIYLDAMINNAAGKYHTILMQGVQTLASGNSWGRAVDITQAAYLTKYKSVLEQIAAENPKAKMIFADDFGPDNDAIYGSLSSSVRTELYDACIEMAKILSAFCADHGWICAANAEWRGDRGHGYPNKSQTGCALVDIPVVCEHHDDNLSSGQYWYNQVSKSQGNMHDKNGNVMNLVISSSVSAAQRAAQIPGVAWVCAQSDYSSAGPQVTQPHSLGIPLGGGTPTPPPPSLPKPSIPIGFTTTAADSSAKLSWTANPGSEEVDYYVTYQNDTQMPNNVTSTSTTVSGLTNGTSYNFRVSAHNASGHGDWTAAKAVTPVAPTPTPPAPSRDDLLKQDFQAIINRLAGVETWNRLTAAQRQSIVDARTRAQTGLGRLS